MHFVVQVLEPRPENESFETLFVLGGLEKFEALEVDSRSISSTRRSKMKSLRHFDSSAAWKDVELRSWRQEAWAKYLI